MNFTGHYILFEQIVWEKYFVKITILPNDHNNFHRIRFKTILLLYIFGSCALTTFPQNGFDTHEQYTYLTYLSENPKT